MKISEFKTTELVRMLKAAERTMGTHAVEVKILKRELSRRDGLVHAAEQTETRHE